MFINLSHPAAIKKIQAIAKQKNTSNVGALVYLTTGSVPEGRWGAKSRNVTRKGTTTAGKRVTGRATKRATGRNRRNTNT